MAYRSANPHEWLEIKPDLCYLRDQPFLEIPQETSQDQCPVPWMDLASSGINAVLQALRRISAALKCRHFGAGS